MERRTTQDIINDAKTIISRVSRIDVSEMGEHALFRDELGIDSLLGLEIVASCEKRFGVKIDETALAGIERVGEFFRLLISACQHERLAEPQV